MIKVGDGFREGHQQGAHARTYSRNNLIVGGIGGGKFGEYSAGSGRTMYIPETDPTNDFDYDGLGTHETPFEGLFGEVSFRGLEELRRLTTEKHAVQLDMNSFPYVEFPHPAIPRRPPPDLRLAAGSPAIDAALPIPNANGNFRGAAPDLGAYELNQPLPHYGPRPEGVDEETEWRP